MLGRLIQGYSKGVTGLESTTEEAHSRSLLWPTHHHEARSLLSSPPATPVGSPTFRVGPFDDRGGLELNDTKDVRIIIAQDAFGSMDRPMVLFDTQHRPTAGPASPNTSANQAAHQQRNRSTTISGPSPAWARPSRDTENNDRINRLLDCMFGVTSATKSESSTKMHVLFSSREPGAPPAMPSPLLQKSATTRAPLIRSRTSIQAATVQKSPPASTDESNTSEDVVLITRMFTVTLPESKETVSTSAEDLNTNDSPQPSTDRTNSFGTAKRPKLVEKKIPMFAVGLLLTMPPEDAKASLSRPPSRTSFTSSSFPNSLGSDIASSWTLLESIADSLGSSAHSHKHGDHRIELVTNIWDVILRCLRWLEYIAREDIRSLLQQVNREVMTSMVKTPKGPHEQRTNQRNIYIRQPYALETVPILHHCCRQVLHRVSASLRIPRVITGIGFLDGHWLDEARYLVQMCGSKAQNFFLFSLLTAFLGNHPGWLERIESSGAKDVVRQPRHRNLTDSFLAARTIIVGERRSIARRLIFLLASFLPMPNGMIALDKDAVQTKSPLPTPGLPSSSPLKNSFQANEIVQHRQKQPRNQHVSFSATDAVGLSTSASSSGSVAPHDSSDRTRPRLTRIDSETESIRTPSVFPIATNTSLHLRKASAANSATTPNSSNPVAYFAAKSDSYFPEDAVTDGPESVASADLARILRRDSSSIYSTGMPSPKWPALLNGFWPKKQDGFDSGSLKGQTSGRVSPESARRGSTASTSQLPRLGTNKLRDMVSEAHGVDVPRSRRPLSHGEQLYSELELRSDSVGRSLEPPRLQVDEEDGVVEVDVGLPGFMSWEGDAGPVSPRKIHPNSTSVHSLSGLASLRSSVSHATGPAGSSGLEAVNVAGFLKRYHEDFALQAVKPYEELYEDVKQSMLREDTLLANDSGLAKGRERSGGSGHEWVEVCSTLIADLRKFTIEHIILRRKRAPESTSGEAAAPVEHNFVTETIHNFDTTLTDAIESMLGTATRQSAGGSASKTSHQRTTSSSTTASNTASTPPSSLSTGYWGSRQQRPQLQASCRQVVTDALEEVVKSVKDDLQIHDPDRSTGSRVSDDRKESEENALREGVRKWLLSEETRAVW